MPKKMLFNATETEEVRAAIVEDNNLLEYDLEARSREQNRNNIYRGYIVQVEASIQAAFVEYGTGRHGFLPFREIHPDFYSRKAKNGERNTSIEQVIKKGQQVVVQVVREEVDHKGAALTTYCTLPGRYLVLMPHSENSGISRKIEEGEERQALRKIMRNIKPPEGFGYIVRTAGLGKTESDIRRDLDIMIRLWRSIQKAAKRGPRSGLIFQDADIVQRMIRDYFESDVNEIWIDDRDSFERAHTYFSAVMPDTDNVVKYYEDDIPLFAKYQLEDQINQIYSRQVPLPSGGSIVIDTTEALVAIDVNSGKTQSDKTEDTAFKTNCEAAIEIAKQLRMRDLGGLIVIDFIGMRLTRHMRGVERTMREAIKDDKARIRLGRITSIFGLLTLSRQRIRDKKDLTHFTTCPACRGTGRYPNVESNALKAYRHLQKLVATEKYDRISASLPKEVALYLLNFKRNQLSEMENEFDIQITVMPKDSISLDLERDISVQIRSRERQKKRKERTPIELPFERISNQLAQKGEKQHSQGGEAHTQPHTPQQEPQIELPDPHTGPETYFEDGWDRIAHEKSSTAFPDGSLWFLRHMKEDRSGPSIGQLARRQGLQRPKKRIGLPQPASKRQQQKPQHKPETQPKEERKKQERQAPPERAEQHQPKERKERKERKDHKDHKNKQRDGKRGKERHNEKRREVDENRGNKKPNHANASEVNGNVAPPAPAAPQLATPPPAVAESDAPKQDKTKGSLPLPAEILAQHNAKAKQPTPQRPAAKPISYRPAPYHPLAPPVAQKPEAEGGVWSNNELARIRRAAEQEQRRMTRWDHGMPEEATQPTGVRELQAMAQSLAPGKAAEVTVTPPAAGNAQTQGSVANDQRKVLKRPAKQKASAPAASKSSNGGASAGKRSRWTEAEIELLQSLCHLPLQEAKAAFEAQGYARSLNAFRNRYYSLRGQ